MTRRVSLPFVLLALVLAGIGTALALEVVHADLCRPGWEAPSPESRERCSSLLETEDLPGAGARTLLALLAGVLGLVGALVADRQPRHPVGWLLAGLGLVLATGTAAAHWAWRTGISAPGSLPGEGLAALVADVALTTPAVYGVVVIVVLLLPDGKPLPRWRGLVVVTVVATASLYVLTALRTGSTTARWRENPLGIPALEPVRDVAEPALLLVLVLCLLGAVAHTVVRYRGSVAQERDRLRPIALACAFAAVVLAAGPLLWSTVAAPLWQLLFLVALAAVPVTAGAAVLRRTLFDVDVVVHRTLVYTVLAGFVLVVHLLAVAGVGSLVASADLPSAVLPLVATVVAAVAFEPMRRRAQRGVDRLLHGDRRDPSAVLGRLAAQMSLAADARSALDQSLEAAAHALRLPWAAVDAWTGTGWARVAVTGIDEGGAHELALVHQEEQVGRLVLGERREGELRRLDPRVQDALARSLGSSLHALLLADELAESRTALVSAHEEERRRLRRELHDGLGAALAGLGMGLHAARLTAPDSATRGHLEELAAQTAAAATDLRRLVDGLRPPALDEAGLPGAVRDHAARLALGLVVDVVVEGNFDNLPASVELAAYRIASEALTNVARHAQATRCRVRLVSGVDVLVEVTDDGVGIPTQRRPGVGLLSMAERAREVGGTCRVGRSDAGGTSVVARLPLERERV